MFRVLKSGGTFLICNEADGQNRSAEKWADLIDGMTVYTAERLRGLLKNADFTDIRADGIPKKGWLCLTAVKP